MRSVVSIAAISGAVLLSGALLTAPALSQGFYNDPAFGAGMMGPGMMGRGMMMGPNMMMGRGMMGPGMMGFDPRQLNLNLSADDVKAYFERWLFVADNPHLKVGNVTEKDADTYTVDIVTTDKEGLVQRYDVDKRSGLMRAS